MVRLLLLLSFGYALGALTACSHRGRSTVAFVDDGQLFLAVYGSTTLRTAPGGFRSQPALLRISGHEVVMAVLDQRKSVSILAYDLNRRQWNNLGNLGGFADGRPALAADGSGRLVAAVRVPGGAFFTQSFKIHESQAQPPVWEALGGVFASDPVLARCPSGDIFLAGIDTFGRLWSRRRSRATGAWTHPWTLHGGDLQGDPSMICVARANHDVAIMAARSRQNHLSLLFISGLPGADWLTSSELVLSDPRLSLAGQRPIVSARSARGGLRACWIQVGRIPDSCFSLSNAPGFFAPCPTGDEPRFIGLFAGGYLRWWDWPDENWSPSLTLAVRSPSLVAETN